MGIKNSDSPSHKCGIDTINCRGNLKYFVDGHGKPTTRCSYHDAGYHSMVPIRKEEYESIVLISQ